MSDLNKIFREIHTRSLWQVTGIYLAAGWLALQVVGEIAEATPNLPDWVRTGALIAIIIGLPVVLATAFIQRGFKGAGEGQTDPRESTEPVSAAEEAAPAGAAGLLTWRNAAAGGVIIAALWGVVATVFLLTGDRSEGAEAVASGEPAIAVLPFAVMSPDPDGDAYFVDGVHEQVISALAKTGLTVKSRTTVLAYADPAGRDIPDIATDLEVTHVLEGSVRLDGNRVLVTAQLIDGATDNHTWNEDFGGDRTDIFGVQTRVAEAIAGQLSAALAPADVARLSRAPTDDLEAYDLFLRGKAVIRSDAEVMSRATEAIDLWDQAIARDSGFALAWAWKGNWEMILVSGAYDLDRDRYARGEAALARALELDPDLPDAVFFQAEVLRFDRGLDDEAERLYGRALELDPGNPDLYGALAAYAWERGDFDLRLDHFRTALELERLPVRAIAVASGHEWVGQIDSTRAYWERAVAMDPARLSTLIGYAGMLAYGFGDTAGARLQLEQVFERFEPRVVAGLWFEGAFYRLDHFLSDASVLYASVGPADFGSDSIAVMNYYAGRGLLHRRDGRSQEASADFRLSLDVARAIASRDELPDPTRAQHKLTEAWIAAAAGDTDLAEQWLDEGGRGAGELPRFALARENVEATVAAWLRDGERVAEVTRRTLGLFPEMAHRRVNRLRFDPLLSPVRDHPAVVEFLAEQEIDDRP